jgi:uncharacterized phage-associated protein
VAKLVRSRLDVEKAVEVLLYVTSKVPDMYAALKMLYFADRMHLERHGRFIYDETYVAMQHGPVPSAAYDIVKAQPPICLCENIAKARAQFANKGNRIMPNREPDLDYLSETDIECLDDALERHGNMSFAQLREASHDEAFLNTDELDTMTDEYIAQYLPNAESVLGYLRNG